MRDVFAFTIERVTVFFAFAGFGECANVDIVVDRDFSFIALCVGFVFPCLHFDGHVILAVTALLGGGIQCAIGENGNVLK